MHNDFSTVPRPGPQPTPGDPDPRAWLDAFPAPRRSAIANWFHFACRGGASTPHTVCSAVSATIQRRLAWSPEPESRAFLLSCLDTLRTHQAEALAYATYVITYEQLPYEERQQIKGRRALTYAMQGKPTTAKQAALIRRRGYRGAIPADRAEAHALIDRLLQQQGGAQ